MSIKLHELSIQERGGRIVVGKENKRGNLKEYVDISTPVLKRTIENLVTEPGEYFHKEIIDTKTGKTKHYKIMIEIILIIIAISMVGMVCTLDKRN